MKAEIIAIGTEIVLGQLTNTNSIHIADALTQIGVDCHFQTNVDDDIDNIATAITQALTRSDVIICCGGLGPTQDDLTKEAIAQALKVDLVFDEGLAHQIEQKFVTRQRVMSPNNLRQAHYPQGAIPLSCFPGTAPGLQCDASIVAQHDATIFATPGVPREMKAMLTESILPWIEAKMQAGTGQKLMINTQTYKAWGLSESEIAERLDELDRTLKVLKNPTLSFLASGINGIKIRLTTKSKSLEESAQINAPFIKVIKDKIGDYLYAESEQDTLENILMAQLRTRGLTIGIMENFTAGILSSRLANIPAIESVHGGSLIELTQKSDQPVQLQSKTAAMKVKTHFKTKIGMAAHGIERVNNGLTSYEVALCVVDDTTTSEHTVFFTQDLAQAREFGTINLLMLLRDHLKK